MPTRAAITTILAGTFIAVFGVAASPAGADPAPKVTICHATSATDNPYVQISVSTSSLDGNGKNDHQSHTGTVFDFTDPEANEGWGDIIPSAEGVTPLNAGEAALEILANGCNGPQQGSCPDGSQPQDGTCPTEETCPNGELADGGECPDDANVCELDAELAAADDPACTEPEGCPFDDTLAADDPGCTESEECPFDEALEADDADCVEAEVTTNDPTTPADPKAPIEVLPSVTSGVAVATPVPAATLPVTGRNTGTLALIGSALVALGSALVATQRRQERLG